MKISKKAYRKKVYAEARKEIYRRNFPLFCAEQLKIISKDKGIVPFVFNRGQKKLWRLIFQRRKIAKSWPLKIIVLKARQIGLSTFCQGLAYHRTTLYDNITALTMAHDIESTENIFRMARIFHKYTDPVVQIKTQYESKKGFEFQESNSRLIIQTAGNIHAGASFTINFLHLSEVARYKSPDLLDTSFFPSVPHNPSSVIIVESTAKGAGAWFQDMWKMAEDPQTRWLRIFIPWYFAEEYSHAFYGYQGVKDKKMIQETLDEEEKWLRKVLKLSLAQLRWRRNKIQGDFRGDKEKFRQEFPSTPEEAWVTAGQLAFDKIQLRKATKYVEQPKFIGNIFSGGKLLRDNSGNLWIWKHPEPGVFYDIGADISQGTEEGNLSTAEVIERHTKCQVAEWRGRIGPIEFAKPLALLGTYYNNAQIAPEVNSMGCATLAELTKDYYNLYRWRYRDEVVPRLSKKLGWVTTRSSKDLLISTAKHILFICGDKPLIRSQRLMDELLVFVTDGLGRYYAVNANYTDDLVMAWLISLIAASDEEEKYSGVKVEKKGTIVKPEDVMIDKQWERILGNTGEKGNKHWLDL